MGLTGYSEHAGSLWKGHEGWRAARLSLSYVTGPSSRVSVDPLHVPLTSSTSSPPFLPPGPLFTQGGWCKVNLAGSLNLCFMKTPSSRTYLHNTFGAVHIYPVPETVFFFGTCFLFSAITNMYFNFTCVTMTVQIQCCILQFLPELNLKLYVIFTHTKLQGGIISLSV